MKRFLCVRTTECQAFHQKSRGMDPHHWMGMEIRRNRIPGAQLGERQVHYELVRPEH